MSELDKQCNACEENEAVLQISLTDLDGLLLDSVQLCVECFDAVSIASVLSQIVYAPPSTPTRRQTSTRAVESS